MNLSCPACGSQFTLDAATSDADARRFAALVAGLHPQVGKPLIQYLVLFKPTKTGLPLTSHGYLIKMLAGGAEKIEGKQEQKIEQQRQSGAHRPGTTGGKSRRLADLLPKNQGHNKTAGEPANGN